MDRLRRSTRLRAIGSLPWPVLPALALVALILMYPLFLSASRSIGDHDGGEGAYSWLFANDVYLRILLRTFTTAGLVTLICLLFGYPFAYLMTVVGPRARIVLVLIVLIPFWTSGLVRTFAWLVLLEPGGVVATVLSPFGLGDGLLGTQEAVLIGMAQLLLPFMVLPLYSSMQGIDRNLVRAAESLGARPATAFLRIFLPLSLPGILAGSLIVFILSLGFYVVPALLGSPTESLVSQTIYQQVSGLLYFGRGGALALVLLAGTLLVIGVVSMLVRLVPGGRGVKRDA